MTQESVLTIFRETIMMILTLAAPLLLVSLGIGLIIAIFQAATQINEQTLTFVPKIVGIGLMLVTLSSWMLTNLTDFWESLMSIMSGL